MSDRGFSRRHFFCGTLPAGGFGSTPSPGSLGYKSLNENLNVAAVGFGIRGLAILVGAGQGMGFEGLGPGPRENFPARAAEQMSWPGERSWRKEFDLAVRGLGRQL